MARALTHKTLIQGFSMIEVLITLSIAAALMSIGIPSFNDTMRRSKLASFTNQFVSDLNLARTEAIKTGLFTVVSRTGPNAGVWEDGWEVFNDSDNDNVLTEDGDGDGILCERGEDCLLRRFQGLSTGYTLRGNGNYDNQVRFTAEGAVTQAGSFALCENLDGSGNVKFRSKVIIISLAGRVRLGTDEDNNGIPLQADNNELGSCTAGF